ncbi:MAG: KAP family P-loop NTPase fold protein [Planctomycetota bacterium]|jgi:hypothetical protein
MAKAEEQSDLGDMTFEQFVKRTPQLTVLTDQPLTPEDTKETFTDDPFNFRYKVGPVFDILRYRDPVSKNKEKVEQRDLRTPMAILISGGWGTGKTSAMKWLECLLEEWNRAGPTGGTKVRPVWFYPWKYHKKEDVWRGLIAEVILNAMNKEADSRTIIEAFKTAALFIGKSAIDLAASTKIKLSNLEISGKVLQDIKNNLTDAIYPEAAYLNPYEKVIQDWLNKTLSRNERMVIFIDDLDRCMPEVALQVLEALKLYLNTEKLIFVLGVDKEVVEKLVVEHYKKLGLVRAEEKDRPETKEEKVKSEQDRTHRLRDEQKARLYLSKMFQVEIELSPNQQQVRAFLDKHLAAAPYWSDSLSVEHQRLFRGLLLTLAGRNPREVKRILNSALMSGAGIQMMKIEEGKPRPSFEQGLQDFFIRRILQRPYYERIAGMIDTDEGRRFLHDWSQFVLQQATEDPDGLNDLLPAYAQAREPHRAEDK